MQFIRKSKVECYMNLMGGLGNQLFQFAAGINHSAKHGCKLVLDETSSNIRRNCNGNADLLSFQSHKFSTIRMQVLYKTIIEKVTGRVIRYYLGSKKPRELHFSRFFLIFIQSAMLTFYFKKIIKVWRATKIGYEQINFSNYSNYLIGYFQSYKYASDPYTNSVMRGLKVSSQSIDSYRDLCVLDKPLIVHVRLGDYLNEPSFGLLSEEYYSNSILFMMQNYNFKSIHVFSDDIESAKDFIPEDFHSICRWMDGVGETSVTTLEKMRFGSAYIIANSTFSWWGAFLSYSENPPVIAPKPWFIGINEPNELIPPHWIRMNR
jgi:hypothetical protein